MVIIFLVPFFVSFGANYVGAGTPPLLKSETYFLSDFNL